MISETSLEQAANGTIRQAVVTLRPKRRTKFVREADVMPLPLPAVSPIYRCAKMKRSGRMHFHWRVSSNLAETSSANVPPEVVSFFHEPAHAIA